MSARFLLEKFGMHANRASAGRALASVLSHYDNQNALVLGIPRGGVVVAAHLAVRLHAEIDVLVVRQTAIAIYVEGHRPWIDPDRVVELGLHATDVEAEIRSTQAIFEHDLALFRGHRRPPSLVGRSTILVDDGSSKLALLSGALAALRERTAGSIILALPNATAETTKRLGGMCDELVALEEMPARGIDLAFRDFETLGDYEVIVHLGRARACKRFAHSWIQPNAQTERLAKARSLLKS